MRSSNASKPPRTFRTVRALSLVLTLLLSAVSGDARQATPPPGATAQPSLPPGTTWTAAWTASVHGPYPSGNPAAQPVMDFAFPTPASGASDQTLRLMVRPSIWGSPVRVRFANTFGDRPLTLDDVFVGLQGRGGTVAQGTKVAVTFGGSRSTTIPVGQSVSSDAVALPFVDRIGAALLEGRRLAVSVHTPGSTGPMTWHAKALTTSYLTPPGSGSHGADEGDDAFAYTTTSWFFLDGVDVAARDTRVIVCFGDSITDGTGSTLNGDDRWPDVLAQRLRSSTGPHFAVVNAGIGGNRITGPARYEGAAPVGGGPSALDRLDRDVLSVPGLSAIVWLEGINDLSNGASAEEVIAGLKEGVRRMRAAGRVTIVGATITSALGASGAAGTPDVDARRKAVNTFIRTSGLFDFVADFDAATVDPATGRLKAAYQPNSTVGGAGDSLHPNRAGYQAMANTIHPAWFTGAAKR